MNASHVPRHPQADAMPSACGGGRVALWSLLGLAFLLVLSACTSGNAGAPASLPADIDDLEEFGGDEVEEVLADTRPVAAADEPTGAPEAGAPATQPGAPEDQPERGRSDLADQIEFLGSSLDTSEDGDGPTPVSIDIPGIDVTAAPVTDVGVEPNGDMEIPGASEVGWYRFGPRPGDTGSAVLAAHIAYNGVDGVFRNLTEMRPGDLFSVNFSDGSAREFQVLGLRQWSKLEIPLEDLFARDGTPRLVLITCGGNFNRALDSYDDNVVVVAIPTDFLA